MIPPGGPRWRGSRTAPPDPVPERSSPADVAGGPGAARRCAAGRGREGPGFTLVEVLVVLTILAVAAAAAAPRLGALLDPGPRAAAEELAGAYRQARALATDRARLATVTVDVRTGAWRLFAGEAPGEGASAVAGGNLLTDRPGARIRGAGGRLAVIRFDGRGRAWGPTLEISDEGSRHRVRLEVWTGGIEIR